jgi:hypothetical protein
MAMEPTMFPLPLHRITGRLAGCLLLVASLACIAPARAATFVIDNTDAGFNVLSQTWSLSSATGQYGTDYRYKLTSDAPAGEVEWRPVLPTASVYEVAVYYRTTGVGRPNDARYTIDYAGGSEVVTIDQQVSGSTWVVLGTWPFAPGNTGRVRLTSAAEAGKTIVADAVRFREVQPAAVGHPGDLDKDGDVDAADLDAFLPCMLRPPGRLGAACVAADLDADADVDLIDFGLFQRCFSGSGQSADVSCTGLGAIPVRASNALTGSQFIASVDGLSVAAREQRVLAEVTAGNVPTFWRTFVPITAAAMLGSPPALHVVTYYVAPDYLAIGSDADFIRMPMGPRTAQAIGDAFDCSMLTRKMVNDIYAHCAYQLEPYPYSPAVYNIVSIDVFIMSNATIEDQRAAAGAPLGAPTGGTKKDVVITAQLAAKPGKVAIYGWHQLSGAPIQPLYLGHEITYMDYSHGIRLVQQEVIVDGQKMPLYDLLKDPVLCVLVSDEGVIADPRYH